MSARVSGLALARIFLTTLAGISSRRSVASSACRLSMMLEASFSERDWMMYCWASRSSWAKTSAALFLGRIRNIFSDSSSSMSSMTEAMSASCMSSAVCRSFVYCLVSRSSRRSDSFCRSSSLGSISPASVSGLLLRTEAEIPFCHDVCLNAAASRLGQKLQEGGILSLPDQYPDRGVLCVGGVQRLDLLLP